MLGTTDWLLKRFLKFLLKRIVGKYLTSEIDLEQLDVKLDTGRLELKNLLLNCDAINKDLSLDGWYVKAGFVESVNAQLPSIFGATIQCSIVVNQVMLTVAPMLTATPAVPGACSAGGPADIGAAAAAAFPQDIPAAAPPTPSPRASAAGGAMSFLLADDFGWTGHGAVMDGIKRIAGSLQSLLQHMRLEASNVLIRVELPHPTEKGRVVTAALKLDLIEFGDLSSLPATMPVGDSTSPSQQGQLQPHQSDHRSQSLKHKGSSAASPRPHARAGGPGSVCAPAACTSGSAAASGAGAAAGTTGRREIAKHVQVKGLSLDLFETTPLVTGAGAGAAASTATGQVAQVAGSRNAQASLCPAPQADGGPFATAAGVTLVSGPGKHGLQVSVELRMVMPEDARQPTQVTTGIHIGAVRLQLLPSHAVCLTALKAALDRTGDTGDAAAEPTAAVVGADSRAGGGAELWASSYASASSASMHSAAGHWGRRSLMESILMPNCEGVVAHSLEPYMMSVGLSYGDANEFDDACSRFGSLASSLVSSVTQTGTNLLGYVAASGSAAVGGALDWMGTSAAAPAQVQQPAPAAARVAEAQLPPTVAAAAAALSAVGVETAPPPVVVVRAHVSHAALVLCYGPPVAQQQQAAQQHAVSRRSIGTFPGTGSRAAGMVSFSPGSPFRGIVNGTSGTANTAAPSVIHGSSGSLVAELQDLNCDVQLDAAHGNLVTLQAGQLQVYEQLPMAMGAGYGMTPAEWGRVTEVLPQAPHRFRPTQPAPSRSSAGGAAGAGNCSLKLGPRQQPGRIANASGAGGGPGAGAGVGGALQTWPILSCASTHASGAMAGQPQTHAASHAPHGHTAGVSHPKLPANRHSAPPAAALNTGAGVVCGGGGGGHGCLRLRASWGGGGAAGDCTGYDRYGVGGLPGVPSYDLSVEVLPVTVWLSLPLVQRLTDFAAPLASEPAKAPSSRHHAVFAPKPVGPLPRLSLTVVAPHVCILLALVPSSASASPPAPRPPGTPVFIALDVVSPPHPAVESPAHGSHPHFIPHHGHSQHQPQQHYHGHHQHSHQQPACPHHHGLYGAVPHGGYGGSQQAYGWAGPPGSHGYGGHGYAAPQQGRAGGPAPHWAWAAPPEPPALLTVYHASATDRLVPSQVTTVDLTAGVVELVLVRTAVTAGPSRSPTDAGPTSGPLTAQHHLWASTGADSLGNAAAWTSKSLLCLSPPLPQPPGPAPSSRPTWDVPHAAPLTGPGDVGPGCGLHLHVCCDPGVGAVPDLVPEAWDHVTTHAQDRWADPDGEGGAWEERSSFRSVAFHERCRKSSAIFVHMRAPEALLHLTRTDLADVAALPAAMQPPSPPSSAPATQPAAAAAAAAATRQPLHRLSGDCDRAGAGGAAPPPPPAAPAAQSCVLLEVGLRIQLQDDPPAAPAAALQMPAAPPPPAVTAGSCQSGSTATVAPSGAGAAGATGAAAASPGQGGLGPVLWGSRVAMYELVVEEMTLFRATDLGVQSGCNVTSVHTHGVTLLGHLEQHHPHLQQQLQQAVAAAQAGGAAAHAGLRPADPRQQRAAAAAFPSNGTLAGGAATASLPARRSLSGNAPPRHAICLLHCPVPVAAADNKQQPSYIEYVCVEGRRPTPPAPPAHDAGRRRSGGAAPTAAASSGAAHEGSVQPLDEGPAAAATTAMHSVLLQGVTVSTDYGYVTMDWAVQLGQLMEALASPPGGRAAAAAAAPLPGTPSSPRAGGDGNARGHLAVNVVDLALRHEPMDYPPSAAAASASASGSSGANAGGPAAGGGGCGRVSPVALALIIEAVHLGLPLGGAAEQVAVGFGAPPPAHTVVLHSLTLHLAAADQRGPGWTAADPRAIREPLLQACGYHRVLQEASIKVVAKQRRFPKRSKVSLPPSDANVAAAAAAAAAVAAPTEPSPPPAVALPAGADAEEGPAEEQFHLTLDVEVTNQHLLGMLTVESATLLAHFAMQAGTLMTARQAAAVAAAAAATGAPLRRDLSGRPAGGGPADLYWDAASENGSSAVPGSVTCGYSEASGDSAGSLLTALLLEEVDENAFRRAPPPAAAAAAGAAGTLDGGAGTLEAGDRGGWYAAQGSATEGEGVGAGLAPGGLILIDDFFPVNHQGEYDEDLTLVQHPPKGGSAAWRRDGAKAELEGTWYGPDEGPDKRRMGPTAAAASYGSFAAAQDGGSLRYGYDCEPPELADGAHRFESGSGALADVDLGMGSGGFLASGGPDAGSEDPDIDDLLMAADPRDVGADPRVGGGGAPGAAAGVGVGRRAPPSVASVGSSAATRSSSAAPTWRLQEDYVRAPRKSDEDGIGGCAGGAAAAMAGTAGTGAGPELLGGGTAGSGGVSGGCAPLGGRAEQPPPVSRITFKDLSGIWVMHTAAGVGAAASGQQEGRVELVVEGLGLVLESYGPGGHLARHMKLTVHHLEIRDCALEVKQQQAAAAAGARPLALAAVAAAGGAAAAAGVSGAVCGAGASGWVRVLGYRDVRGRPRDSRAPLVALALTAVRPNPAACDPRDEEFRLAVALLPLRLKLNQDIMSYLKWYGTSVSTALKPAAAVLASMQAALSELDGCEPLPPPYFQHAQIRGFSVMLDYRPRRVDIGALAEGRLLELLNLVPLGGVDLVCKPLRLAGVQGWDGVGAAVLREWLNDIARTQAHKFIAGLAPVNAVVKVGTAVATLVSAPARHLARRDGAAAAGRQIAAQLRRTSATFAHRLVCEAMSAGRKAASGAGKALARVGSSALGAAYGGESYGEALYDYPPEEEEEEQEDGGEGEAGLGYRGRRHGSGPSYEIDDGGEDGSDGEEGADGCGDLHGGAAAGEGGGGRRRGRSASTVVRKGLSRAAHRLGSASQQVAAGLQAGGLQRGVSNVARVLSAAAISGVSAAAPASAVLQGQLKGTLRSMRRALRGHLSHESGVTGGSGGDGGGGGGGDGGAVFVAGGYPLQPRPKED